MNYRPRRLETDPEAMRQTREKLARRSRPDIAETLDRRESPEIP